MKVEARKQNEFICEVLESMGINPKDVYEADMHFSVKEVPTVNVKMFIKDQHSIKKIAEKYHVNIVSTVEHEEID